MQLNFSYILIFIVITLPILAIIFYRRLLLAIIFNKYRIREKISISFLLLFLASVVLIGVTIGFVTYQTMQNVTGKNLQALSASRAAHIQTYLEQDIEKLKLITNRTALRKSLAHYNEAGDQADIDNVTNIIKDASVDIRDLEETLIFNVNGNLLSTSNSDNNKQNANQQDYFINGKEREGVYFIKDKDNYKIFISGPITLNNQLIGIGVTVLKIDSLARIIQDRIGLGETGEITLSFYDNKIFEAMTAAASGQIKIFLDTLDYRNIHVIAASAYVNIARIGVVAKIDRTEALGGLRGLLLFYFFIIVIFSVIYYLLSVYLAKILTSSLEKMRLALKGIEVGNPVYNVQIKGQDEIAELSQDFKLMIDRIKNSQEEINEKVKNQTADIVNKSKEIEDRQRVIINILEDEKMEKEKAESLAHDLIKFKLALDNASDHIVITDAEGIALYGNKGVETITGYSLDEVVGKKAGTLWSYPMPVEFYQKLWKTIKTDKKTFSSEIINRRKNGQIYNATINISPVLNDRGEIEFFVGIERDITVEKEVDRSKTELISLASHQLRTPLSSINWYVEMLLDGDVGKLNPDQTNFAQEIYAGNKRMIELVNALLNVSRLDLGVFVIEPEELDITKLADIAIKEINFIINEKKIKFTKKYDKTIGEIKLDEKLTMIILQNLLSNAVKYTLANGQVSLEIKNNDKNLEIIVVDSGIGIPKFQQEKIFGKLFRADNAAESAAEGTGLGLYIVKQILDYSGGKVWFKSVEDKGTTFYVNIPLSGMKKKIGTKKLT